MSRSSGLLTKPQIDPTLQQNESAGNKYFVKSKSARARYLYHARNFSWRKSLRFLQISLLWILKDVNLIERINDESDNQKNNCIGVNREFSFCL